MLYRLLPASHEQNWLYNYIASKESCCDRAIGEHKPCRKQKKQQETILNWQAATQCKNDRSICYTVI